MGFTVRVALVALVLSAMGCTDEFLWGSMAMGSGGGPGSITQVTKAGAEATASPYYEHAMPVISGDGGTIIFLSPLDPFGTNPDFSYELFAIDASGGNLKQLTNLPSDFYQPFHFSVSNNGGKIAFSTRGNLLNNSDGNVEVFTVDRNGENLVQVTNSLMGRNISVMSANGDIVGIASDADLTNTGSSSYQLYRWDGTVFHQLTDTSSTYISSFDMNDDANVFVYNSSSSLYGFRVGQAPVFLAGTSTSNKCAISADGSKTVFVTFDGDSHEVEIIGTDGNGRMQLTNSDTDSGGFFYTLPYIGDFDINRDGSVVAYISEHKLFAISGLGGLPKPVITGVEDSNERWASLTADGKTVAFVSNGDLVSGFNPDGYSEVFTAPVPDLLSAQ